ncbi:hypothetical protein C8R45DRAFT_760465, partial [Mycena sanguinolenta]
GVCEPPTEYEMAQQILTINAGAVGGLQALDYFQDGASALKYEKHEGFIDLYQHLDNELTADEKARLHWGPICLEHALCKYKRFASHI